MRPYPALPLALFLAIAMVFCAQSVAAQPSTNPSRRIATTAPSLTELVYSAGAGDQLVAVSAFSDYPAAAKKLPQVADANGVNIEALLVAKPDLVLVWPSGTRDTDIARLNTLGIRTVAIGVFSLGDVPIAIRRIGQLAGTSTIANISAALFERRLADLQQRNKSARRMTAFFEISRMPLMTVNGRHFIAEVMRVCGADNVFADVEQLVFEPSREALLIKNPQVIFHATKKTAATGGVSIYEGTDAGRTGRILSLDADSILRPGPRLIDAVEQTCRGLNRIRDTNVYVGPTPR